MRLDFLHFLIYLVILPTAISSLAVYLTIMFSTKHELYDSVGGRKIHSGNVPRLGGLGFVIAFVISILIFHFRFPKYNLLQSNITFVIGASILIFIMGIFDDLKNWKAIFKFLVQCFAAFLVLFAGFKFTKVSFAPIGFYWQMGILSYPITFLWIIGITNAVNLLDGIDGQAGCLSGSLLISYSIVFWAAAVNPLMIYICVILVFVILGFLFFNLALPKAKIFMGDGGSQFLGFILAVFPLMKESSGVEAIRLPFAICFLMLPIFDVIAAVWRRKRDKKPISVGDKFHIHHKLMLIGFSPRGTLTIFMILQIIIDMFVTMSILLEGVMALVTLIGLMLVGILFFYLIHFEKQRIINQ